MTALCRLHVELRPDRRLARRSGGSVRYVKATVMALPETQLHRPSPRALNLGLAVDVSGSMKEDGKLDTAKKAAHAFVDGLDEGDLFSLVTFGDTAHVLLQASVMDEAGRRRAHGAIDAIAIDGMTALSEGWFSAAECLVPNLGMGRASRVIILSDGNANRGIKDISELSHHASKLSEGGVSTTTVGIGDGYNAPLLQAIAENGGGQMHDAERNEEILEVLAGELQDLRTLVAENVTVRLKGPSGAYLRVLTKMPSVEEAGIQQVTLGSLGIGRSRDVVFVVGCLPGEEGHVLELTAEAEGTAPGGGVLRPASATAVIVLARSAEVETVKADPDVARTVVVQWHAAMVRRVVGMNRDRNKDGAKAYLSDRLPKFERYAAGVPDGKRLTEELRDMLAGMERTWDERARKNLDVSAYKMARGESDYRSALRGDLTRNL